MLYAQGLRPWDIDRLTMREVVEMCDAWRWAQELPGSNAWLLASLLNAMGAQIPWTARTVLGRSLETNG